MLAVAATALTVFGLVLLPSSPSGDRAANTLVAHGQVDGWPALWKSTDGREWHESLLPWEGSVQAVAISFDRLVVLGIDSRRGREIVARSLDQGWAVQAADAPDTGLVSTGTGFVGRGRLVDGTTGYLYSRDGLTWEPVGSALSLHEGDVASLHYEGGATILRTPGVAGDTRPPDTPVSALWRVGERIWVQTPGVVWSSTDGTGCSPLRLDRRNGIGHGAPLLLPFEDRALVSVAAHAVCLDRSSRGYWGREERPMLIPSTTGRGLVNLIAELESRFTGSSFAPRLDNDLADLVPEGSTVCLALFDGLGASQATHVESFATSVRSVLHAPFPTTTTVSLASIATGRVATGHGVLGHLMWLPDQALVANVLKFVTPGGGPVKMDHRSFLPGSTVWERLSAAGVEPITVQPGPFADSPLSRAMYRGCRFEAVWSKGEWVDATVQLASQANRFVFAYWPDVDVAAHVSGRASSEYRRTVTEAGRMWQQLRDRVGGPLIGTADHGHLDYRESGKILLRDRSMESQIWFGDSRALMIRGDTAAAETLLASTEATLVPASEFIPWLGEDPDPHPQLAQRLPDLVALAADDTLLLPPGFDRRLVGYHGGLSRAEVEIPLLIG